MQEIKLYFIVNKLMKKIQSSDLLISEPGRKERLESLIHKLRLLKNHVNTN